MSFVSNPSVQRVSRWMLALLMTATVAGVATYRAGANHQPADKVAVSASTIQEFSTPADPNAAPPVVTLLRGTIKTASPTDLMFLVNLECTLFTDIKTVGDDESGASTHIDVWVTVDGAPVPVTTVPANGGPDNGKVTFCDRSFRRVTSGFEGDDEEQDANNTIEDFLRTKSSHGFNWLKLNLGSSPSPHVIEVKATITHELQGNKLGNAQAIVGKRTLLVLPAKLANDAVV